MPRGPLSEETKQRMREAYAARRAKERESWDRTRQIAKSSAAVAADERQNFVPYPLNIARMLADEIERRPIERPDCVICNHVKRRELNILLLSHSADDAAKVVEALIHRYMTAPTLDTHRADHLVWQIKHELIPEPTEVFRRPVPPLDNTTEMAHWHWWRMWAVAQKSWDQKDLKACVVAEKELRALSMNSDHVPTARARMARGLEYDGENAPPPENLMPDRDTEILKAFQGRTYRDNEDPGSDQ